MLHVFISCAAFALSTLYLYLHVHVPPATIRGWEQLLDFEDILEDLQSETHSRVSHPKSLHYYTDFKFILTYFNTCTCTSTLVLWSFFESREPWCRMDQSTERHLKWTVRSTSACRGRLRRSRRRWRHTHDVNRLSPLHAVFLANFLQRGDWSIATMAEISLVSGKENFKAARNRPL